MPVIEIPQEYEVVVYAKRQCSACVSVKRWLLEREIDFTVFNAADPQCSSLIEMYAVREAPMVVATFLPGPTIGAPGTEIVFSGFRTDVLDQLFPASVYPKTRSLSLGEVRELAPTPDYVPPAPPESGPTPDLVLVEPQLESESELAPGVTPDVLLREESAAA